MSKITLEPNNSGSGTFTIAAPNSNTNRTLTLPDEAGTALTDATDLEPQVKTSLNATGDAPLFACRAWVNFDSTGTVSIRDSGNVSSITDNGNSVYVINFTTAMTDINYCISAHGDNTGNPGNTCYVDRGNITSSSVIVKFEDASLTRKDPTFAYCAIFR